MRIQYLPSFAYERMRWRNQLGWTREIAREVDDLEHEIWRVSIAEIDHDSAYSAFPGLRREQVLLEGNGMSLTFADGRVTMLEPPHGRVAFDGSEAPHCTLTEGPVRDFNLFFDPQQRNAELQHRPLVGTMLVFVEPRSTWLIYLMAGHMLVRSPDRQEGVAAFNEKRPARWTQR